MDTSTPIEESFLETLDAASSSASSIHMEWNIHSSNLQFVEGYRVHYQKVASTYIHYGPVLEPSIHEYEIENLVADTYYKVCLVVYRNGTVPFRECIDASTTNWQLPVSVGSSIGAILALSMIVLIVLLSRCNIPLQYRGKKTKRSQRYDTISSNYHDDQYDFSETATHGQDDDYTSEYDHDDDAYYEIHVPETRRTKAPYLPERPSLPNGLSRSHVHPHTYVQHQNQHRNSLGRIPLNQPHHHHHPRQMRAYSMQAAGNMCFFNHPCSPLAKEPRKHSLERGDSQHSADAFQYHAHQFTNSQNTTAKEIISPTKGSLPTAHKTCSPSLHAFSFIDENPETTTSKASTSKPSEPNKAGAKTLPSDNLLITDIDFDDMSQYGATGGVPPSVPPQRTMEMSSTNARMLALPESISFEEHSV